MSDLMMTAPRAMERREIEIAGVRLELHEAGQGRPLLYLHDGLGFEPTAEFAGRLADDFRLIAPSHPGFGASGLPMWIDTVDDFAHIYLEMLDRLDLRDVVIVGVSIGAWVAAEMATKDTHRIAGVVLASPLGIKVGPRDRLDIPDIFAMPAERLAELTYRDPSRAEIDVAAKTDEELATIARNRETLALVTWDPYMQNPKLKHRLQRIDRPVLVLRGEHDGLVSPDYAAAYAALIPGAALETVSGAGHLPQVEQPEAFTRRVRAFAA